MELNEKPLISVIIPVYNVEPYLRQCLDSVVGQTYENLEILIIDDGSTDGCGKICDEYAQRDERIKVFHTENRGLSAARNLGIDEAAGEYLYFLDSDDWIDPDFLNQGLSAIGDADILNIGNGVGPYTGIEALAELINGRLSGTTWSMLYRKECFSSVRFPEGRIFEDISTSYILLNRAQKIVCAEIQGHHYRHRKGSISNTHNLKNIFDYILAVKEQYAYCKKVFSTTQGYQIDNETKVNLQQTAALAISRAWAWRYESTPSDSPEWERLANIARTMFPYSVRRHFSCRVRGGVFLARFNHPIAFWLAHKVHKLTRKGV